jgi:nucleoside 2-deoxyribosyltransferase
MRIFLVCSVRAGDPRRQEAQEHYVACLEKRGHTVHYPPRDTDQSKSGLEICRQNLRAIRKADEVHVFYFADSQGTHFDIGMAFALKKKTRRVNSIVIDEGKSFPRMLWEWETEDR